MLELIGFDGDDTLWQSQDFYDAAQAEFERIVGAYVDLADVRVHERLLAVEAGNIQAFGYGAKGMTLSMIEAAFEITGGLISSGDLHRLVGIGKEVLAHPVTLLPGIREAVEEVAARHRIVLITKGDLIHQQAKVRRSDLGDLFHRIEIVSEKDPPAYARVLEECSVEPAAFAMVGNSIRYRAGGRTRRLGRLHALSLDLVARDRSAFRRGQSTRDPGQHGEFDSNCAGPARRPCPTLNVSLRQC